MWGAAVLAGLCLGSPAEPLRVAVETAPPFVVQGSDGEWTGISVELFKRIADKLGWPYVLEEHAEEDLADLVASGQADVGIGALPLTAELEAEIDFSHPYLHAGLAIAVARRTGLDPGRALFVFTAPGVLRTLLIVFAVVAVVGLFAYLIEFRHREDDSIQSLEDGLWWSVVTMTTVGYGDKTPHTRAGRIFAVAWMLLSLVLVSVFTAVLASAFTAAEIGRVDGPEDLNFARVAAVRGSNGARYLHQRGVDYRSYPFLLHAIRGLRHGDVDALVYDGPTLRYVTHEFEWLPLELTRQDLAPLSYAFILPPGSAHREPLNRALLRLAPTWRRDIGPFFRVQRAGPGS